MVDRWIDTCSRTLIIFLVYCLKDIIFLKPVDALDAIKTTNLLYKLFREVVLMIGPKHVMRIMIDNVTNYVIVGKKLKQEFCSNFWSSCTTHYLNLILKDIEKLDKLNDIVKQTSKITKYIYNHSFVLSLIRKHTNERKILRLAPTRFGNNFITLQSILNYKHELHSMITFRDWVDSTYSRDSNGKTFFAKVLYAYFWKECDIIVKASHPFIHALQKVNNDERL